MKELVIMVVDGKWFVDVSGLSFNYTLISFKRASNLNKASASLTELSEEFLKGHPNLILHVVVNINLACNPSECTRGSIL